MDKHTVAVIIKLVKALDKNVEADTFSDALDNACHDLGVHPTELKTEGMTGRSLLQHPAVQAVLAEILDSVVENVELFTEE